MVSQSHFPTSLFSDNLLEPNCGAPPHPIFSLSSRHRLSPNSLTNRTNPSK
jgi:hypothetical protein